MTAPDLPAIEARADVWRVVERSGAVHGLRVEASQCPIFDARFAFVALSTDTIGGFWSGPSPMGAVAAYAESSRWDVVAILAPGEPTRAALRAERDALAARLASEVAAARSAIYARIEAERVRQDAKWGEQNHPDVDRVLTDRGPSTYHGMTSPGGCSPARMAEEYGIPTESRAKASCDGAARLGQCTWAHIAVEELAEVIHAATLAQQGRGPEEHVDKELVQLAAVVTAWIEARGRRTAPAATTGGAP